MENKTYTNFKNSFITKIILTILLFIVGAYSATCLINIMMNYSTFGSLTATDYKDTRLFKYEYTNYVNAVIKKLEYNEVQKSISTDLPSEQIDDGYEEIEYSNKISVDLIYGDPYYDEYGYYFEDSDESHMEHTTEETQPYYPLLDDYYKRIYNDSSGYTNYLDETNTNFFYYVLNLDNNAFFYNEWMSDYILEKLSYHKGYSLTSDDLYDYCTNTNNFEYYCMINTVSNEYSYHLPNQYYSFFNIFDHVKGNYLIFTFYQDETMNPDNSFDDIKGLFEEYNSKYRDSLLPFVVSLVLFITLLIVYTFTLGHRKDSEEIHVAWLDKVPMEIIAVSYAFLMAFVIWIGFDYVFDYYFDYWSFDSSLYHLSDLPSSAIGLLSVLYFVAFAFTLLTYSTIVKRLKTQTFIKSFLLYRIVVRVWGFVKKFLKVSFYYVKKIYRKVRSKYRNINTIFKHFFLYRSTTNLIIIVLILFAIYETIFLFIALEYNEPGFGCTFMFLGFLALSYFLIRIGSDFNQMLNTTENISNGNINTEINTNAVMAPMKKLANQINNIGTGLTAAVEDKIKSERLKTELITNVSHDIKTPLTSIITYVDLLEKEELNNEKAYEYLAVLKDKSWRLKTLLEDLVEASKASTGNINLTLERLDFGELIRQSCGEYEDQFRKRHLETILNIPEEPVIILADGRSAYRIIENLLLNAAKYSLEGTRVYIDVTTKEETVTFIIKNISSEKLNISTDELLERFVRGDSSRNTDGNGLGISIAKSLTDLLHGTFDLSVDGDLFKVMIEFPLHYEILLPELTL